MQLDEFEELRRDAYENSKILKERTKKFHDQKILRKDFKPGHEVLLGDSWLHVFPFRSRLTDT